MVKYNKIKYFYNKKGDWNLISKDNKIIQKETKASYSPSGMSSYLVCPAFAFLPSTFSEAAKKGVELHKIADEHIKAYFLKDTQSRPEDEKIKDYVEYVLEDAHSLPNESIVGLETKLITAGKTTNGYRFSTIVDYFSYEPGTQLLKVVDLKTGNYEVSAENNKQLLSYAYNIMKALDIKPKTIHLIIHQNGKAKVWEPAKEDFKFFVEETTIFFKNLGGKKKFVEGSHCNSCFKQAVCPQRTKTIKKAVKLETDVTIANLDSKQLTDLYDKAKKIAKMHKLLETEIKNRHETGSLDGFVDKKVVRIIKSWKDKKKALQELGKRVIKEDIVSVKDAEKIFKKDLSDLIVEKPAYSYVVLEEDEFDKLPKGG